MTSCPRCQSAGNGQCVCQAGLTQGQAMAVANQGLVDGDLGRWAAYSLDGWVLYDDSVLGQPGITAAAGSR